MISSSPDIKSVPADPAQPTLARWSWRQSAPRAVRLAAALAGVVAIGAYLFVALSRLTYPFALEWLEGNSLAEVHRIVTGQPLYPAPTAGYVPDGYSPLYFAVSAGVARVLGVSYLSLRLVSLLSSLACFALLARLVQRETGSVAAGSGAAGLFAATYFATGTWFDVGRVDSLFLALSIGSLYAARWMRTMRGAVAVGVLLAAVVLTKQTGLAEGVAVLATLVAGSRRRLAGVAALVAAAVLGVSTLALSLSSGGWYFYYVFQLMGQHPLNGRGFLWFGTALLSTLGIAACAALTSPRWVSPVLLAGCIALAVEGGAALVHSDGGRNDMLPAYLAVALLAGLALGRSRVWWATVASGLLVLAQLVVLLAGFHPAQAIPSQADRAVGERLLAGMRGLGGTIAIPADPGLNVLAGMAPTAHEDAAHDVLRATNQTAIASFRRSAAQALATHRFSAIITDGAGVPPGYPETLGRYYHQCPQPLLAGVPAARFRPVAGVQIRPVSVWLPRLPEGTRESKSCPAVVRLLDGTADGGHR
ncbi:MAG TPA: glycosyltransferase family 39 protein [Streptosporangiaceae bacterium]|nr:glycosyltransferase family 39 protein [Streptosporangiaceae bacterium]